MKQSAFVKRSGPYKVESFSQAAGGVRMVVYPAFPQYGPEWAIQREVGEGGGPNIFTAIDLAKDLESLLNQPYTQEQVRSWQEILAKALAPIGCEEKERAMKRLEREHDL